ncbi:MAG: hypothetical protein ACREFX_05750 [Opitutaceae bacterium]
MNELPRPGGDPPPAEACDWDGDLLRLQQLTARRADELARQPGRHGNDLALWLEAEIEVLSRLRAGGP